MPDSIFNSNVIKLLNHVEIHLIHIDEINIRLKTYLDFKIVEICEGAGGAKISEIKLRLIEFLESKNVNTEIGAISEFFIHLYLNHLGYNQECMFFNLEERSIKKGFDGFYTMNNEEWIVESKSGLITTSKMAHQLKIKEAYSDLHAKLKGEVSSSGTYMNDPWKNAYNHASHADVGTEKSLREKIKKYSREYTERIFHDISEFNIIPSSTIFYNDNLDWVKSDLTQLSEEIISFFDLKTIKKVTAVCISKKTKQMFWDYLRS